MSVSATLRNRIIAGCERAFAEFLALPLIVVIGFILLSAVIYGADDAWSRGHVPSGFAWLNSLLGDNSALSALLTTVASSIITVTSITFSLLLIALQQGASALTAQVSDQFLMRRTNQFYFGFFVGLSVYVLLTLVTVSDAHRPVFGTSIAVVLTIAALCMIVVMIYNTIDQMRPAQIVRAIHQHVLRARVHEISLLKKTRRQVRSHLPVNMTIRSDDAGHIADIKIEELQAALDELSPGAAEAEIVVRFGAYLAWGDPIIVLRAGPAFRLEEEARQKLEDRLRAAIVVDNDRDLGSDPSYGIYQLSTIGWTSVSTAKSNPSPGQAVIGGLRDIISRWGKELAEVSEASESSVIYADKTPFEAIDVLEMIILVSSESMQAQTMTDAVDTLALLLADAPQPIADRLADVARRGLSSLGEHVLTRNLEAALHRLAAALALRGFSEIEGAVRRATHDLTASLGHLNSRSTRVPARS